MYWNAFDALQVELGELINRNMGCIEMKPIEFIVYDDDLINRNMGCIEINAKADYKPCGVWLIETWDVLKLHYTRRLTATTTD